jgi:molybdenum cofactor cytidylyltransferase
MTSAKARRLIAGILLAAGESTRMGRLKALLPWRGTTLFQAQISSLLDAGLQPVTVVLGHRAEELRPLSPPGVQVVVNERYREGRSTSVIAGISALPADTEAVVVASVDQPTEAAIVQKLVDAYGQMHALITLPSIHHRRGHPGLFDRGLFSEMLAITEDGEGLRAVLNRHAGEICYVNFATELVRTNLNSPEDYDAAFARWGQPPG